MTIVNKLKKDSILDINPEDLRKLQVPPELFSYYSPDLIQKMGKPILDRFFEFDNFIFKIPSPEKPQIQKAYFNIDYLHVHPEMLK